MPVTYSIDPNEKLIRTTCVGEVTLDEVVRHFRELEQDPNCLQPLDVFLDLSETSSVPLPHEIGSVAAEIGRIRKTVRFNICAVVATRTALFGMLRMLEVIAGAYFTAFRVFRLTDQAEEWLASQRSQRNVIID
jgi:hypothetical protein